MRKGHRDSRYILGVFGREIYKTFMKGLEIKMNNMRFNELLTRQFILDENIKKTKGINETRIQNKVIALEVELSEFANELRFFKFWSNKRMDREKALTEYVDGLHFFLSIANDLDIDENLASVANGEYLELESLYAECKRYVLELYINPEPVIVWGLAFNYFWTMGKNVGFTEDEIYNEYLNKNQVNHERQQSGY